MNSQLAKIFLEIAEYLAMDNIPFKPAAYEKAARGIESLEKDIEDIYREEGLDGLEKIPGVGKSIAEKIEEYIRTGKIKYYQELKKEYPVSLLELSSVEGLGPKHIKTLYDKLEIKDLADLEKAAREGEIEKLPRFGKKVQENILRGIEFVKAGQGRMLLGSALPLSEKIKQRLEGREEAEKVEVAGSLRRMKETVGDLDILAVSGKPEKLMEYFCSMPEVEAVLAKGETKSSVRLVQGLDADLRIVSAESYGSALQYFTGSKDHGIKLRRIAQEKGLKLNEYGIFKGEKQIAGQSEEEVYETLGLKYINPEIREDAGEIEASRNNKLPKLVNYDEIKGDLQMHSTWSDGSASIREMAQAAKKIGYEYIAITDHIGKLKIAGALDEQEVLGQWNEIDKLNKELDGIKIFKGAEADLDEKGRPEFSEEFLSKFDLVLGSIHSKFRMAKDDMTQRLINALENPLINIIAHPTGRIIGRREAISLDIEKVIEAAKENKKILEINCYPDRLDLKDQHIRIAVEKGVRLSLGTDSHSPDQLPYLKFGLAQARRGWAERKDIVNCLNLGELKKVLTN